MGEPKGSITDGGERPPTGDEIVRAIARSESVVYSVLDASLRFVQVGPVVAAMFGKSPAALIGESVVSVAADRAPDVAALLRSALESGSPMLDVQLGERFPVSIDVLPIVRDERVAGLVCVGGSRAGETAGHVSDRFQFEELLTRLSTRFIEIGLDDIDTAIVEALEGIGLALQVDRITVFERLGKDDASRPTHHWLRAGLVSAPDVVATSVAFPWAASQAAHPQGMLVRRLADLPAAAMAERRELERRGVRSFAAVLLRVGGETLGAIAFEAIRAERDWTPITVLRLELVAAVIANALQRRLSGTEARELRRFESLVSKVAARFVESSASLGPAIAAALEAIVETAGVDRAIIHEWTVDASTASVSHAWSRAELDASPDPGPVRLSPWFVEQMRSGGAVAFERLSDVPREAASEIVFLERHGVRSWIALPLRFGSEILGAVSLTVHGRERRWSRELESGLRVLGEVLASAIVRDRAEKARREAFEEVARLRATAERERDYLREEIGERHHLDDVVAKSPAFEAVLAAVDAVARTNATVLVRGESGVGKEVVSRLVHARSGRHEAPLVKVNCASVPRELFESEFFGHVRGSFTGAHRDRPGRFELADRGTLFLDEVGEIPIDMQAKLLRVLQEGEIERVGDDRTRRVDVRVVCATNRDLLAECEAGRFRRDLYYRLSVFPILVPPLRERIEDVLPLAEVFLRQAQKRLGRSGLVLTESDRRALQAHPWPGNVRELAHVIERAVIVHKSGPLRLDLGPAIAPGPPPRARTVPPRSGVHTEAELRDRERANFLAALEQAGGRVGGRGGAAELLGVSPSTLRDRLRAAGIDAGEMARSRRAR